MTTKQHGSKTGGRGDWQPVLTPENADERRMFDHSVQVLGGGNVLRTIAGTLLVYARQAPQNGSYAQSLYIMANEVAKAASTSSPQSPSEPGRGDVLMRRVGKKTAGRLLDGRTHDAMPTPTPRAGDLFGQAQQPAEGRAI